jgi:hypothetical protein
VKNLRIDLDSEQVDKLRLEVFCNQRLSEVQRRREVRKVLPLPQDGSKVDLFCDGQYVATV